MKAALSSWDAIAAKLPGFEARPQQLRMAELIARAIHRGHVVVEAGTGVGKSFAYLVPALEAIRDKGATVVVSTRTIALQEQLVAKDVPFLLETLDMEDVPVALAKGRNNYVCRRRAEGARSDGAGQFDFAMGERFEQLQRIVEWARASEDGSLSDLGWRPDPEVWDLARAERGNCLNEKCPFYAGCAWQRARGRLSTAKLVVANHTLVFLDLQLRMKGAQVLPDYDVLVLDEAHEVAEVATESFAARLSEARVKRLLDRLFNPKAPAKSLLRKADAPGDLFLLVDECRQATTALFDGVATFRPSFIKDTRIRKPKSFPDPLGPKLSELRYRLGKLRPQDRNLALELKAQRERLNELRGDLQAFLDVPEGLVYWYETNRNDRPVLCAAPLDVGPLLRRELFGKVPTVVLTSATLQVGGRFDHLKNRLGLDEADELDVGSPFDFKRQCRLVTFPKMPDPRAEAFEPAAHRAIEDLVVGASGGAFLLFTSYRALEAAFLRLQKPLEAEGLLVLRQGDRPTKGIVEAFRDACNCVLFATDTFWQGIDIRGKNLRLVVLHKLPFAVPDHPLRRARDEACTKRGGNPFIEISVPEAVIRVKQGFGRLIRSATDRGTVAILDPRIHTKGYGRTFLSSLPECAWETAE